VMSTMSIILITASKINTVCSLYHSLIIGWCCFNENRLYCAYTVKIAYIVKIDGSTTNIVQKI